MYRVNSLTIISVATYVLIANFQLVSFEIVWTFGEYLLFIFHFILLLSTLTRCFRAYFVLHRVLISSRCITQRLQFHRLVFFSTVHLFIMFTLQRNRRLLFFFNLKIIISLPKCISSV